MVLASDREPLLTGRPSAVSPPITLVAGPVAALLDGADLRHLRVGDIELVQRVYVAVRYSATFYETTGWRGVTERDAGSPDARFPSAAGDVFPGSSGTCPRPCPAA